MTNNNSNTATL